MARVARGVDDDATMKLLRSGGLAADAAGALRTVISGGTVVEEVAKHWNDSGGTCPHCKAAPESVEHRMWQCLCWDGVR
eukprot:11197120-Lingulodinium_polyedra.AAC.1